MTERFVLHGPVIIRVMRETEPELDVVQELLDSSFESSGEHLRNAFQQTKRPSAAHLVEAMAGIFEMHLAALSGAGAPLVAPIDAMWLHGRVWFGLPGISVRARLLQRDNRVSSSYVGDGIALIAHGAAVAASGSMLAEFEDATRDVYVEMYGPAWLDWQAAQQVAAGPSGFTGFIEPRVMFATAP